MCIRDRQKVAENNAATQEEVDAAWKALMTEIHKLGFVKGDITSLEQLVATAKEFDLSKYVEAGQAEFKEALAAAEALIADKDNAMQAEIETAETNLLNAMLNLRYKADKSILEEVVAKANDVDANAYTAESYAVLSAAVAEANDVLANENATQEEVDTAVANVQAAMSGLVAVDNNTAEDNTVDNTTQKMCIRDRCCTACGTSEEEKQGAYQAFQDAAKTINESSGYVFSLFGSLTTEYNDNSSMQGISSRYTTKNQDGKQLVESYLSFSTTTQEPTSTILESDGTNSVSYTHLPQSGGPLTCP